VEAKSTSGNVILLHKNKAMEDRCVKRETLARCAVVRD
jgi:hypothetical protein